MTQQISTIRMILSTKNQMIELGLRGLGGILGLGTLAYAIINSLLAQRQPTGQQTGAARQVLRTPYLIIASVLFLLLAYVLWIPLPLQLPKNLILGLSAIGTMILLPSLGLYVWGLRSLGRNFNASSGFGVRLHQGHRLVTSGPYQYIRHPMYLAVILACWGGLLLYLTWTMVIFAFMMCGLFYRGSKEEEALAQAFGSEWEEYKSKVPGWLPGSKRHR
ncbi:MAG TPA: isoprenylcysteine carboxylmethyltransferase family protein [Anaerolineales bacterium]|nr:isoprenylcysteine carboxylmethyltransferase family protein [Anaerolineales bacterium]